MNTAYESDYGSEPIDIAFDAAVAAVNELVDAGVQHEYEGFKSSTFDDATERILGAPAIAALLPKDIITQLFPRATEGYRLSHIETSRVLTDEFDGDGGHGGITIGVLKTSSPEDKPYDYAVGLRRDYIMIKGGLYVPSSELIDYGEGDGMPVVYIPGEPPKDASGNYMFDRGEEDDFHHTWVPRLGALAAAIKAAARPSTTL